MQPASEIPKTLRDIAHLDDLLSAPTEAALDAIGKMEGDFLVLGAAGKMGPTLSRMLRRCLDAHGKKSRVIAVSRFSTLASQDEFKKYHIETIKADLLDQKQLDALPQAPNIIYMAGMKFGATNQEALTWAMNVYLPGMVCNKFRQSRIIAFSSGNIYGLSPLSGGGSLESGSLDPLGDYAMSVLGRERIFEHFSRTLNIPISIIRLNYAVEMRYGVLHDIAMRVYRKEPIDLAMGNANVIWQGDANAMSLATFAHVSTPPFVINVAGPELISVKTVARQFGEIFDTPPTFTGTESPSALISNGQLGHRLYGYPKIPLQQIIHWTADWIRRGAPTHNKPTHFEARDGKY